jgi:hypothetical protein
MKRDSNEFFLQTRQLGDVPIAVYTIIVYTEECIMKNITLSAEDKKIELAREVAREENRTLNDAFREWLDWYGSRRVTRQQIEALYERLKYVNAGRKFTRDEMNER